jgi:Ni/Fe-hydrogenase 1 B-type cytochrome subunit
MNEDAVLSSIVRVYVWELPVRLTHWLIVASIAVLSVTGIYIGNPSPIFRDPMEAWLPMSTVKMIHSYTSIVFVLSVLARVGWMFVGNTYARWDKFLPVTRRRWQAVAPTVWFYSFRLRKPPGFVGHNPLAGLTYTLVFVVYFVMIATGFAMYSAQAPLGSPMRLFQSLIPLFGDLQMARWLHHGSMWALIAFAVHHVYSAVLMSQIEANATVESIFSGYKFVPREDLVYSGYRFVDRKDAGV